MKVVLKRQPQIALAAIASFIESENTKGNGKRFVLKFSKAIEEFAVRKVHYALCNHHVLASLKYSCIIFNKWVIAFTIEKNTMVVHKIIHGSILK